MLPDNACKFIHVHVPGVTKHFISYSTEIVVCALQVCTIPISQGFGVFSLPVKQQSVGVFCWVTCIFNLLQYMHMHILHLEVLPIYMYMYVQMRGGVRIAVLWVVEQVYDSTTSMHTHIYCMRATCELLLHLVFHVHVHVWGYLLP